MAKPFPTCNTTHEKCIQMNNTHRHCMHNAHNNENSSVLLEKRVIAVRKDHATLHSYCVIASWSMQIDMRLGLIRVGQLGLA